MRPSLNDLTESQFLSLTVKGATSLSMSGKLFDYVAIHPWGLTTWALPAEVTLGGSSVRFTFSKIVDTAGVPIDVTVLEKTIVIDSFLYTYIGIHVSAFSVYVETHNSGDLTFIFLYYQPTTDAPEEGLWLVLRPAG